MDTVGVRDLKSHLSHHLKRVRAGARLVVTDRGQAVATIAPVASATGTAWARRMVADGGAQWGGGKPVGVSRAREQGPTVSDAIIEDRG